MLRMTIHKQFCCARTVWKDTMTHRAVTYFSQLPARRVIMSVGETTAGLRSKLYGWNSVGNVSCSGALRQIAARVSTNTDEISRKLSATTA